MLCQRCMRTDAKALKMSWFNTEMICSTCQKAESKLPEYQFAKEMERQQVLNGNYNYRGIGLPCR